MVVKIISQPFTDKMDLITKRNNEQMSSIYYSGDLWLNNIVLDLIFNIWGFFSTSEICLIFQHENRYFWDLRRIENIFSRGLKERIWVMSHRVFFGVKKEVKQIFFH